MNILIIGAGKVGFYLAKTLTEHGHRPTIVERDKQQCTRIANELDAPVICGDGTTLDVLELAKANEAATAIAVTGKDEANLVACQLAKNCFGVPKTVARVNNPKNMAVLKQLGVDIPISSTDNIARIIEREVDATALRQVISISGGTASISEVVLPPHYAHRGVPIGELGLPRQSIVASVSRGSELIIPRGDVTLEPGDKLLIIAQNSELHKISQILVPEG